MKPNFIDRLLGTTQADLDSFEETRKDFFDDYTSAERIAMQLEDDLNYVSHVSGIESSFRDSWDQDGVHCWQMYVIDQHGQRHIVAEGSWPIIQFDPEDVFYIFLEEWQY